MIEVVPRPELLLFDHPLQLLPRHTLAVGVVTAPGPYRPAVHLFRLDFTQLLFELFDRGVPHIIPDVRLVVAVPPHILSITAQLEVCRHDHVAQHLVPEVVQVFLFCLVFSLEEEVKLPN